MADSITIGAPLLDQNVAQPETPHNEAINVIDATIAKQLNIAMTIDTDYTLDNIGVSYPQEWQNGVLIIDSVLHTDATSQLILPDGLVMRYLIKNNSGSGFGVTFITATGAGLLIPDDDTYYDVYADGTDIVKVKEFV